MPTLLVIIGPTGVGKTELALRVAERFGCPIVNADSRQIYREIPIGTAAPTAEEQARVKHYFVGTHNLTEDYNAGQYERDALEVLSKVQSEEGGRPSEVFAILTGGSMMYIDAVCKGLDDIPTTDPQVRAELQAEYEQKGLAWLQTMVEWLDPEYFRSVDRLNAKRLLHCYEVCRTTGRTYSELRKGQRQERPWRVVKIGLNREREQLYDRINRRVEVMVANGLEQEARAVYSMREKNSLQTVGYREMFRYMDGDLTREEAVALIQQNSRHYAKRQLTWWRRDNEIHWLDANQTIDELIQQIDDCIKNEK